MTDEASLRPSPPEISSLVHAAPVMLWASEANARCTFANPALLEFVGRVPADFLGREWAAIVHPDDLESGLNEYEAAFRDGRPFSRHVHVRRADGVYRWVDVRGVPQFDDRGLLRGFIGSCTDITDLKHIEGELRQSEERFRRLVENAHDAIYRVRVDASRKIEYASPAIEHITGHGPDAFYANANLPERCIHPDDRHLLAVVMASDPSKLAAPTVLRWVHADGRIVWAEHRRVPVYDADGHLVAVEGVARDISERIEAERRLADSESRFRLLAENAADLVYRRVLYPTPRTEYISPAAKAITGREPVEFYANPNMTAEALHPDDRHLFFEVSSAPELHRHPIVVRWVHPDGRIVFAEHRNTPVYGASGELIAIEGIGRDVTDTREKADRLRVSEAQLRQLSMRLQSAREDERSKVSRELHNELGQLLTGLQMELRRTVDSLLDAGLPLGLIDRTQSLVGGIEMATGIVRRIATELRPPALDHLGLAAAIGQEAAAIQRRTGLRCHIQTDRENSRLSPRQATAAFRVFQEAVTNVLRHAGASVVRIKLSERPRMFTMEIRDDGRGISRDQAADPASIGLLGMREQAHLLGGSVEISGVPGKGTAVTVRLPLKSPHGARRRQPGVKK